MRETYVECVAPRPNAWWKYLLLGFLSLLTALGIFYSPGPNGWIFLLAAAVFAFLIYRLRQTMNIEFEYILNGNDLSVDKVINQKKRKHLANFRVAKIEFFAPIDAPQLYNHRRRCTKTSDYSSGKNSDQYAMCYVGNFVILTPSKKLLAALKPELPYKFVD